MMHGWYGWNGMSMLGGAFMMLFWPILIGIGIYFLVKTLNGNSYSNSSNALKILDEKYAIGDITEEEYSYKKRMLTK